MCQGSYLPAGEVWDFYSRSDDPVPEIAMAVALPGTGG